MIAAPDNRRFTRCRARATQCNLLLRAWLAVPGLSCRTFEAVQDGDEFAMRDRLVILQHRDGMGVGKAAQSGE